MTWQTIIAREAKRQNLSGYQIAKLAGLPMRTVQAYLAGTTDLIGWRVEKIAAVLRLTLRASGRSRKTKA